MHPASPDGLGEFLALHARTGKVLWRHRTRTPPNTAALTTGQVWSSSATGIGFTVHEAATGNVLFRTRLANSAHGFPITYAVNGRQYIAVPVGGGGAQWATTVTADLLPEKKPAGRRRDLRFRVAGTAGEKTGSLNSDGESSSLSKTIVEGLRRFHDLARRLELPVRSSIANSTTVSLF